jgi:hypothetical protein
VWRGALACFTCLDNFFCIFDVGGPVESFPDSLRRQCSWADLKSTDFEVNLSEEFLAFSLGYAFEQWLDMTFLYNVPSTSVYLLALVAILAMLASSSECCTLFI